MPRRCSLGSFLALTKDEPALHRQSRSHRLFWLEVVDLISSRGDGQSVEMDRIFGTRNQFCDWFRVDEETVESAVSALCEAGLLIISDGVWSLPDRVGSYSFKRAAAVKINGKQGGRPAKQAAPEPDRRQRTMPLVRKIEGGRTEKSETGTDRASTQYYSKLKLSSTTAHAGARECIDEKGVRDMHTPATAHASKRECIDLGHKLADILGCDTPRDTFSIGHVKKWLEKGATRELILATAREVAARENKPESVHIGYLTGPILDAVHMKRAGHLPRVSDYSEESRTRWMADMKTWRDNGCVGRGPNLVDYGPAVAA